MEGTEGWKGLVSMQTGQCKGPSKIFVVAETTNKLEFLFSRPDYSFCQAVLANHRANMTDEACLSPGPGQGQGYTGEETVKMTMDDP